ncbi:MAG TPA: branched-chain amino acid ABC transporter substrate-binding protein [Solirubrobacteraceae bacterium]|jgi:branched-chain amino acid transport system substrate-binding protein|nr:branched-chain amino acid ABC transporter substrate-binding protein [Solirubrobacteraceae bacterium]
MPRGLRATFACVLGALALAAGLTGCGGKKSAVENGSDTLTIYSSLPLQGPDRARARDMVNAIKLALQQAHGKVGPFNITYVSLDSATPQAGTWTGDQVLVNARAAVHDLNAIAYIGDQDSAATALSLPLTNEGDILQVSPSSTYVGLTRKSRRQGEPDRFYPSGIRTFGRMVPADDVQASALIGYMKSSGVHSLALVADREFYGGGIADEVKEAAARQGITIDDDGTVDGTKGDVSGLARQVAKSGADAFLYAGTTATGAARIFSAVGAAAPSMQLFGPAAVADQSFVNALPLAVQRRMRVTTPALPPSLLPASARVFRDRFRRAFGREPAPEALQAYEACNAVLYAIRRAGAKGNDRLSVAKAFFTIRNHPSVLGRYSIDADGDTSLSSYAGERIEDSQFVLQTLLKVRPNT